MATKTIGKGDKVFFVVAEITNMGTNLIDIKITDNEAWAKTQKVLLKVKANNENEALGYFQIRDMAQIRKYSHTYSIHQANIETLYKFREFDLAKDFNFERDYSKVYESTLHGKFGSDEEILSKLFTIFNIERPSDFRGHSVSVSDIIILNSKMYYCNPFGWELIENN